MKSPFAFLRRNKSPAKPAVPVNGMATLAVDDAGTVLAYTDTGVPPKAAASGAPYTTVFAVHGITFTAPIFKRIALLAPAHNVRLVALNRRHYPGSAPYTAAELAQLQGGDADKAAFVRARGLEILRFVDAAITQWGLPAMSEDGGAGGCTLLGWSLGNAFTLAAVAHVEALPEEARARMKSHLRRLIMHEPSSLILGLPFPPQTWSPQIDSTIPAPLQAPFFTQWLTSYFAHGDLAARDTGTLAYVLPAAHRAPTIFSMSRAERDEIVDEGPNTAVETPFMIACMAQNRASFEAAVFGDVRKGLLERMEVWALCGDETASYGIPAFWQIEDEDKKRGGGMVKTMMIPGVNHFMQWDDPEKAMDAYLKTLA